jgi:hypothetical protein
MKQDKAGGGWVVYCIGKMTKQRAKKGEEKERER